jgi:hypothetical protein
MFLKPEDWAWPLDNSVQASLLSELLTQEGIPHKVIRHGEALWGYAEQVSEGWGHLEAPEEVSDKVDELYRAVENH